MGTSVSGKIVMGLSVAGILFLIGLSIRVDVPLLQRYQHAKTQRADLHHQNARLKENLVELRTNQERFRTDPEFVARLARKNRRLIPGEIVFVFDVPEKEE